MAKLQIKSETPTPYDGFYFTNKAFRAFRLNKVIDELIDWHNSTYNGHQWNDIMPTYRPTRAFSQITFCPYVL